MAENVDVDYSNDPIIAHATAAPVTDPIEARLLSRAAETPSPATPAPASASTPAPVAPESDVAALERESVAVPYDTQIELLRREAERVTPETDEQRRKRERKEKSKKIVAAVSDGLSALSNLYFTSQYAPDMYNHDKGGMTRSVDARIERMRRERERDNDRHLQFSLKIGDLQNERAKTLRELEAEQERRRLAREKAQREADEHGWLALLQPDRRREQEAKARRAESQAETARAEAENAEEYQRAKVRERQAAAAAHERANVAEYFAYDEHGRERPFHKKDAATQFALQHSTAVREEIEEATIEERIRDGQWAPTERKTQSSTNVRPRGRNERRPDPTGDDDDDNADPTA